MDDKGQALKISYEVKFDGKDYPVTGGPNSDAISFQRVDANTLKATAKKGGKVTTKATVVVSKDGKVTAVNFTDYAQAKPAKGTAVSEAPAAFGFMGARCDRVVVRVMQRICPTSR